MSAARATAPSAMPQHVAIIMDGNGRWAAARHLPRQAGHRAGIDAVRRTVRAASDMGIAYLTLFGFSTENWKRPRSEVDYLMDLLRFFIRRELDELNRQKVRIVIAGERRGLPADVLELIGHAEDFTKNNTGLVLTIAFNYGGQQEIWASVQALLAQAEAPENLTPEAIGAGLWCAHAPDPELVIRTSGEQRLSNFLLWQACHSDLVFFDLCWPDFGAAELSQAVQIHQERLAA